MYRWGGAGSPTRKICAGYPSRFPYSDMSGAVRRRVGTNLLWCPYPVFLILLLSNSTDRRVIGRKFDQFFLCCRSIFRRGEVR